MLLLAIESSGVVASIALMTEDKLSENIQRILKRPIRRHFCR